MIQTRTSIVAALMCSTALMPAAWAADPVGEPGRGSAKKNPLKNVYFGEQHLHTSARGQKQAAAANRCPGHHPGAGLVLADLVHAGKDNGGQEINAVGLVPQRGQPPFFDYETTPSLKLRGPGRQ